MVIRAPRVFYVQALLCYTLVRRCFFPSMDPISVSTGIINIFWVNLDRVHGNRPCLLVGLSLNIVYCRKRSLVFPNFGPPTLDRKGSYKITPVVS